jgi:hypothetical protein
MTTNPFKRSPLLFTAFACALLVVGGTVGGCAKARFIELPHLASPNVSVYNESDARVTVQHWTGRIDYREPTGIGSWRMPVERIVSAGECLRCAVGRYDIPTGYTDLVVRLRMDYIDPVTFDPHTEWMELAHPGPYRVVIEQGESGISIRSDTPGSLAVVPESERIPGHLDDLPIWDAKGAQLPPTSD